MSKQIHYVKIVDGQIKFECQESGAPCHTYPVCDCESFNKDHATEHGPGHEMVHHAECWLQDWFDAPGVVYVGEDREDCTDTGVPSNMTRAGFITHEWVDEWVEFEFAEVTQ